MTNSVEHFLELNALRGWNQRAAFLLALEDTYTGDLYANLRGTYEYSDHTTVNGLAPWKPSRTKGGCYKPAHTRQPGIQAGLISDKVDRLVQLVVGSERGAQLQLVAGMDGEITSQQDAGLAQLEDWIWNAVKLRHLGQLPVLDMIVKGSGCFGFHWPDPQGPPVGAYLGTEWCDVVFVSQVKNAKGRHYAASIAALGPKYQAHLGRDAEGWYLEPPEGADPLDIAFLRYQYRWDEEVPRYEGATATKTMINWLRRDYLPTWIVEYQIHTVEEDETVPEKFTPKPDNAPHNWGVVPLVWLTPIGTKPGHMDGPSLLTRPVRDMSQAADYALSHMGDAHAFNAAPLLALLDVRVRGRKADMEAKLDMAGVGSNDVETDPGALLDLQAMGDKADAKLLEQSGAAMESGTKFLALLETLIAKNTGVVEPDPETSGGVLSGTAMERLLQRLIGKANSYRGPFAEALELFVSKLVHVANKIGAVEAPDDARAVVKWPRIVEQTADDVLAWANAYGMALSHGLLPQDEAVRQFASKINYGGDTEQLVAAVKKEAADAVMRALELAQKTSNNQPDPADGDDDDPEG